MSKIEFFNFSGTERVKQRKRFREKKRCLRQIKFLKQILKLRLIGSKKVSFSWHISNRYKPLSHILTQSAKKNKK